LPPAIAKLIKEGKELAHASDIVFNESKSGQKQGTIGILTNNIINRTRYYIDPVIMALIPFKNPDLY
jgi:inosine/xanthosine triphosphatase